jgi:folate-dependent tRNA-U54 methylase TrmFO/GidA
MTDLFYDANAPLIVLYSINIDVKQYNSVEEGETAHTRF